MIKKFILKIKKKKFKEMVDSKSISKFICYIKNKLKIILTIDYKIPRKVVIFINVFSGGEIENLICYGLMGLGIDSECTTLVFFYV
ncbi:hypothetical protein IC216_14365 [Clostridioides sp. ES-S-0145-01]|uniref:hypothetical protein n=1 Tax=Clostridioides sp. ES-S-0145-01 TaxID=2770784 RepID=UPI001D124CEB|nr:hypothetical protein [Clostridioides sp. ES-S-0145-01]